jgi:predicted MPP superfamily phosphohydrolase
LRAWTIFAVLFLQVILISGHWFIFHTLVSFWPPFLPMTSVGLEYLRGALFLLSISFVIAAVLGYRFSNIFVSLIYKIAAVWLGILNFLFWAACLCWVSAFLIGVAAPRADAAARPWIGTVLFGSALLVSLYGFINAQRIRVRRTPVSLPNLPPAWGGRTALLVTDLHLGNINRSGFSKRIANISRRLNPSIIFLAGDLFDGAKADPERLAAPLLDLAPPFGLYFCGGNHEDFGDAAGYTAALTKGGVRVLHNERVLVDDLQVIGVSYADSSYPAHLRAFLESLHLDSGPASVLLNHVPHRLPIVEQTGVSLQLSGHTHGGQIFPFTLFARWAYGEFTYGLQRFGKLQVLTSSGAGTWGPPMRVGSDAEVVLITFT